MKSVNVAEFRNNLSSYLSEVKAGQEIVVRDRTGPIAQIIPLKPLSEDERELLALAVEGKARLGEGAIGEEFWELPGPYVPLEILRRVMEEERIEG